jgi:nucleoside-diphosphate-sugar epimerase
MSESTELTRADTGDRRYLVVGAHGVTGRAVLELARSRQLDAYGLSRRGGPAGSGHLKGDLTDADSLTPHRPLFSGVTDLVFASYSEQATSDRQITANMALLRGALDSLLRVAAPLRHVTLYQGNKYYGAHLGHFRTPAKETDPRLLGPNFYYEQEDLLAATARREGFAYTLLRPEAVCGVAIGNPMNLLTSLAVYAFICREQGLPLRFPGSHHAYDQILYQVTDARLLARATLWASANDAAHGEAFNVTNGDVFRWKHIFDHVGARLGMELADPQPLRLAEHMPFQSATWSNLVERFDLEQTPYEQIATWPFADALFHYPSDNVSSTIKLRHAGFTDCIDTETMFDELFDELARRRLLPRPEPLR